MARSRPWLPIGLRRPPEANRLVVVVAGITLVALLLRFVFLGQRIAHWDEARVGYWVLHFLQTGDFHYRYIIHGPFVQIANRPVFAVFGASDATARAIVALIGGLLPLSALLFRAHLRDHEVVIVALILATNPILLYYSRFFRSSIPVAAFMFVAFALFVRAADTHRPRYFHAGVVLVGLGFAAKENAAVYLLAWFGAAVLLIDHTLYRPDGPPTGIDRVRASWHRIDPGSRRRKRWLLRIVGHGLGAVLLFGLVILFFYAPRSSNPGGIGLWQALGDPGRFPALVAATTADIAAGYGYWFGGASEPGCFQSNLIDSYLCFLKRSLRVLAGYGAVVTAFGAVGFLAERYGATRPRNLVMFAAYWGFASLLGYPLGMDIFGPWVMVNVVVPLSIPAAIGLGAVYRHGRVAIDADDRISAALAGVVLLVVVGQIAVAGLSGVYLNPQSPGNDLVQYAQPAGEFRNELRQLEARGPDGAGPRVLVYGPWLVDDQTEAVRKPACIDWFNALPLPWYFKANDVQVDCAIDQAALDQRLNDRHVMVITRANETDHLRPQLDGFAPTTYDFRAAVDTTPPRITFFVREGDDGAPT